MQIFGLGTPKPLPHGELHEADQKASDLKARHHLKGERKKKTFNFLNKFKVKLVVAEHAALSCPISRLGCESVVFELQPAVPVQVGPWGAPGLAAFCPGSAVS